MSNHRMRRFVGVACCLCAEMIACATFAATFDFEAPTYDPTFGGTGELDGQDGWSTNSYADANSAGLVTVVNTNPIEGAQSIRYSNPTGGLNDHGNTLVETIIADGVDGTIDMQGGISIRADSATLNAGFFFGTGPSVVFGHNPIVARMLNGNIQVFREDFVNVGSYDTGDEIDFLVEADLDGVQTFSLFVKNVTQGQTSFSTLDSAVPFAGGQDFVDNGTPGTYEIGAGLFLRQGVATYDDLFVDAVTVVPVTGDFDGDGDVDGADFVIWQTNFPKASGGTLATGDGDGDGDVDGADFVVWQTNFPFTPGASPVPEPAAWTLALLALIVAGVIRTTKRRSIDGS